MRPADLINRLELQPFKPFRIHMSEGSHIDVRQAGMVIVGPSSAVLPTAFGNDDEGHRIAKHWRTIAMIHIVQFSDLDEQVNGKRKRR